MEQGVYGAVGTAADFGSRREILRALIATRDATLLPGAPNALTARIIEDIGYHAAYVTGAGVTNTDLGMPDLGLIGLNDIAETTAKISDVCTLPLIVDMDTGFGNALNAYRSMRKLEHAGAAGIQIEDQVFPKKCGHFSGKAVVPVNEILDKIKACLDARLDENTVLVARTDARAVEGFDAAMERAHKMAETGVDLLFVEAPESEDEIRQIGALPVPVLINIVFGGRTPALDLATLKNHGFSLVLYANAALQASVKAMQQVLGSLHEKGSLDAVSDQLAGFEERQRIVGKPTFDELSERYGGN